MSSSEKSQMLQNTVPSIMQDKRLEKEISARPTGIVIIENPTVRRTNATEMDNRFDLEWKNFSLHVKRNPMTAPSRSEQTISSRGLTSTEMRST